MKSASARVPAPPEGRVLTGRAVLACFLGFFAVVFAANAVLVRAALSTFGGVETESSYKAGLAFKQDEANAAAQVARHWIVEAKLARNAQGGEVVEIGARDADGRPLVGLDLSARLHHPTDRRFDMPLESVETGAGRWRGTAASHPGQWDLVIELSRGGEQQFRSVNRVVLK